MLPLMYLAYQIRYLDEVEEVAELLAPSFPDPVSARLGLHELILNALEHGNLGITYAEKSELVKAGRWRDEVLHRLNAPANKHKKIHLHLLQSDDNLTVYVRDEGEGFNWRPYFEHTEERLHHLHGRGIALAKELCFDRLIYSQKGNEVLATVDV